MRDDAADHIIDMGPGPGIHGGCHSGGSVEDIKKCETRRWTLSEWKKKIEIPGKRRSPTQSG